MSAAFHFAYRIFSKFYEAVNLLERDKWSLTYGFCDVGIVECFEDFEEVCSSQEFLGREPKVQSVSSSRGRMRDTYLVARPLRSSLSAAEKTLKAKFSTTAAPTLSLSIASLAPIAFFICSR